MDRIPPAYRPLANTGDFLTSYPKLNSDSRNSEAIDENRFRNVKSLPPLEGRNSTSSSVSFVPKSGQRLAQKLPPSMPRARAAPDVISWHEPKQGMTPEGKKGNLQASSQDPIFPTEVARIISDYFGKKISDPPLYVYPFYLYRELLIALKVSPATIFQLTAECLPKSRWKISMLPEVEQNLETYKKIISFGWPLNAVPLVFRDDFDLCCLALINDPTNWSYVPKSIQKKYVYQTELTRINSDVFRQIAKFSSPDILLSRSAVLLNPELVVFVSPRHLAKDDYLLTVAAIKYAIAIGDETSSEPEGRIAISKLQRKEILRTHRKNFQALIDRGEVFDSAKKLHDQSACNIS